MVRRTGLSRNTIRKSLRSGTVEPKFKVPDRASKPAPYADKSTTRLRIEAGRSRKRRCTVRQMHADLVALGFDVSHGRVAAFARKWKAERQTSSRPVGAAPSCRRSLRLARRSGSTGARIGRSRAANGSSCRWPIPGYRIAGHSSYVLICSGPMRCCSMPRPGRSGRRAACPGAGVFDNMKTAVDRIGSGMVEHTRRVSPTCLVDFERNRYSVPASVNAGPKLHQLAGANVHHQAEQALEPWLTCGSSILASCGAAAALFEAEALAIHLRNVGMTGEPVERRAGRRQGHISRFIDDRQPVFGELLQADAEAASRRGLPAVHGPGLMR